MGISHNNMPSRFIVITVVSAFLALPAIALVLQGFFGSIQYDYPSFYIARIVIVLLFVANALIVSWSIGLFGTSCLTPRSFARQLTRVANCSGPPLRRDFDIRTYQHVNVGAKFWLKVFNDLNYGVVR